MLYYIGVGMGYLYLLMGVIISSAVVPATLTLVWSGQVNLEKEQQHQYKTTN